MLNEDELTEIFAFLRRLHAGDIEARLAETFRPSMKMDGVPPEFLDMMADLQATLLVETDRGCAIVAAAYLDAALKDLLAAVLLVGDEAKGLLAFSGGLGTYSARCAAAHCLGHLTMRDYNDLSDIGRVRNHFAHHPTAKWTDAKVAKACASLRNVAPHLAAGEARERYTAAASYLIGKVRGRMERVQRPRVPDGDGLPASWDQDTFDRISGATMARIQAAGGGKDDE